MTTFDHKDFHNTIDRIIALDAPDEEKGARILGEMKYILGIIEPKGSVISRLIFAYLDRDQQASHE